MVPICPHISRDSLDQPYHLLVNAIYSLVAAMGRGLMSLSGNSDSLSCANLLCSVQTYLLDKKKGAIKKNKLPCDI